MTSPAERRTPRPRTGQAWPVLMARSVVGAVRRRRASSAAHQALVADVYSKLLAGDEVTAAIARLHSRHRSGECNGCDGGPDSTGAWPCRTVHVLARVHGLDLSGSTR